MTSYTEVVTKSGKYDGPTLSTGRGVTQGDPLSLTIFNTVVNEVVKVALQEVYGPQEAQHGFGWAA